MTNRMEIAQRLFSKWAIPCNCGGPQYGTDHAPDCATELAWDDAWEVAEDIACGNTHFEEA